MTHAQSKYALHMQMQCNAHLHCSLMLQTLPTLPPKHWHLLQSPSTQNNTLSKYLEKTCDWHVGLHLTRPLVSMKL